MRRNFTGLAWVISMGVLSGSAFGSEPPKELSVRYLIRETPSDPESAVTFEFRLNLSARSWIGHTVQWSIDEVVIERVQGAAGSWSKVNPTTTAWPITHADIAHPTAAEFASVPLLSGTADAADPADPDLRFSLAGQEYASPPPMYSGRVSQMDYTFTLADEEEPEEEEEDEPVEVDGPSSD